MDLSDREIPVGDEQLAGLELGIEEVLANIKKAFDGLSGKEIANIHNDICQDKIEYIEDSVWAYIGEDDADV